MSEPAQAPRFRFCLERVESRSVLTMLRDEWKKIEPGSSQLTRIDVERTPVGGVVRDASVLASVAERVAPATVELTIYRWDEKDQPTPVNVDRYAVWEDLPAHLDYPAIVNRASTEDNENLRRYLRQNVFFEKKTPGSDHWLKEIPSSVLAVLHSTST